VAVIAHCLDCHAWYMMLPGRATKAVEEEVVTEVDAKTAIRGYSRGGAGLRDGSLTAGSAASLRSLFEPAPGRIQLRWAGSASEKVLRTNLACYQTLRGVTEGTAVPEGRQKFSLNPAEYVCHWLTVEG
jgi:hypothetical protein